MVEVTIHFLEYWSKTSWTLCSSWVSHRVVEISFHWSSWIIITISFRYDLQQIAFESFKDLIRMHISLVSHLLKLEENVQTWTCYQVRHLVSLVSGDLLLAASYFIVRTINELVLVLKRLIANNIKFSRAFFTLELFDIHGLILFEWTLLGHRLQSFLVGLLRSQRRLLRQCYPYVTILNQARTWWALNLWNTKTSNSFSNFWRGHVNYISCRDFMLVNVVFLVKIHGRIFNFRRRMWAPYKWFYETGAFEVSFCRLIRLICQIWTRRFRVHLIFHRCLTLNFRQLPWIIRRGFLTDFFFIFLDLLLIRKIILHFDCYFPVLDLIENSLLPSI